MDDAIGNIGKPRGRPSTGATPVMVRVQPDQLSQIDTWAEKHGTTRPEAIRGLVEAAIKLGALND